MDDPILDDIKKTIINKLAQYGYCGVADSAKFALINSTDNNGNDIKITIKIEEDR